MSAEERKPFIDKARELAAANVAARRAFTAMATIAECPQSGDDSKIPGNCPVHGSIFTWPWGRRSMTFIGDENRLLGKGTFGIVYMIQDAHTGEEFALKLPCSRSISEAAEDFGRELDMLKALAFLMCTFI